jgi:rhodanese-related sulfurtransferase
VIKLIVGFGESLIGRLLLFDGRRMQFRELALAKDPACPVCGESPTVTTLIDYEEFCGKRETGNGKREDAEITARELQHERAHKPNLLLLDVREPREAAIAHIEGARLIPLRELPGRLSELPGHGEIVAFCHHGQRSQRALEILRGAGFGNVRSLGGGIDAWSREIDASVPRY